jgi:hypothetical protein
MDIDTAASVIAGIGVVLTGIGLIFAGYQLRDSRRVAQGEFLLQLDEMFRHHQEVHLALRQGDWSDGVSGPETNEEWAAVDAYMGLFERVYILIERKIIDKEIVDRLYGYRVRNIVTNDPIRQAKLVEAREYWTDFIKLCHLLDVEL